MLYGFQKYAVLFSPNILFFCAFKALKNHVSAFQERERPGKSSVQLTILNVCYIILYVFLCQKVFII